MRRRRDPFEATGRTQRRPTPARTLRSNRALARRHRGRSGARPVALLAALGIGFAAGLWLPRWAEAPPGAPGLQAVSASVSGHRWLAPAEVARLAGVPAGTPLHLVEASAVAERLTLHPWVAAARVAVLAPGRVLLSVHERTPRARIEIEDTTYWVDAEGMPFAPAGAPLEGGALPHIRGVAARAGVASEDLAAAIVLLERLASHPVGRVLAVWVGDAPADQLPILEIEGPDRALRVLLGVDLGAGLERLEAVLAAGLPEVWSAGELDVRFGDQAIVRERPLVDAEPALGRGPLGTPPETADEGRDDSKTDAAARGDATTHIQDARG
ncbi:MAG: FtsQ-type POTRA domain-containing protein [Myxococcota bacterium]|nr:FtsQ-type POTRA domain-containing protein [Myxococcota bacterium]